MAKNSERFRTDLYSNGEHVQILELTLDKIFWEKGM